MSLFIMVLLFIEEFEFSNVINIFRTDRLVSSVVFGIVASEF